MAAEHGTVTLACGDAAAVVGFRGAEPLSWRIDGRELLWHGAPTHWNRSAPILFPVVGASAGGEIRVAGRAYPMPQHGFARDSLFEVLERRPDAVRLALTDGSETSAHYPFAFALEVTITLEPAALSMAFEVRNPGPKPLPYALGVHPAFPWPFDGTAREGHTVTFEAAEKPDVPLLTGDGLLRRGTRRLDFDGTRLALTPDLFAQGALVFLDAASRAVDFVAPSGARITLAADGFAHLALWTKPTAPFVSMEAWTGHADWEDADGELAERASMRLLAPGALARHVAVTRYTPK
jgi:galactose mutarotase-like enzyme